VPRAGTEAALTTALLLLLGGDLHLGLVQVEVGLHLLDGLVRDGEAELLPVSWPWFSLTFSAMARLSQSLRHVPKRV
jgi:hypothetical protein